MGRNRAPLATEGVRGQAKVIDGARDAGPRHRGRRHCGILRIIVRKETSRRDGLICASSGIPLRDHLRQRLIRASQAASSSSVNCVPLNAPFLEPPEVRRIRPEG